jgi:hypothetical protein
MRASAAGERLQVLVSLAKERPRAKLPRLEQALDGRVGPHQRFLLARPLARWHTSRSWTMRSSRSVPRSPNGSARGIGPWEQTVVRLDAIPGFGRTAEILLAEVVTDMARFSTAGHPASCGIVGGHVPGA